MLLLLLLLFLLSLSLLVLLLRKEGKAFLSLSDPLRAGLEIVVEEEELLESEAEDMDIIGARNAKEEEEEEEEEDRCDGRAVETGRFSSFMPGSLSLLLFEPGIPSDLSTSIPSKKLRVC